MCRTSANPGECLWRSVLLNAHLDHAQRRSTAGLVRGLWACVRHALMGMAPPSDHGTPEGAAERGGLRVRGAVQAFRVDDLPIESGMLTDALDNAQRKVEAYFFDIRKQLWEYDQARPCLSITVHPRTPCSPTSTRVASSGPMRQNKLVFTLINFQEYCYSNSQC